MMNKWLIASLLSFFLIGCTKPDTAVNTKTADETPAVTQNESDEQTLGITLEQFIDGVNHHLEQADVSFRLSEPKTDETVNPSVFRALVGEQFATVGQFDPKTRQLYSLIIMFPSSEDPKDNMMAIANLVICIAAATGTSDESIAQLPIDEMLDMALKEGSAERKINGKTVNLALNKEIGFFVMVNP